MPVKDKHKSSSPDSKSEKRNKPKKRSKTKKQEKKRKELTRNPFAFSFSTSNSLAPFVRAGKHIPYVCSGPFNRYTYVSAIAPDRSQHRRLKGITDAIFSMYLTGHHKLLLNGSGGDKACGAAFGSVIDKQLEQWTAICQDEDPEKQRRFAASCHDVVRKVIALFKRNDWVPWKAQVPVCCWHTGLGTCIDLIAQQRDGSLVLIEVKTGYRDNFNKTMKKNGIELAFERPLDNVPVSPLNYALLQALVSWYMYHETYDDRIKCSQLYVLHICPDAVSLSGVPGNRMETMMNGVKHFIKKHTQLAGSVMSPKDRRKYNRLKAAAKKKKKKKERSEV